jgi:predicted permease
MDSVVRDVRFAVRMLLRTPGTSAAAVLALALGIGATTAVFSVVHSVLLRSLGWGEESRLVAVRGNFEGQGLFGIWVSSAEYLDLRKASFFQPVGLYEGERAALQGTDSAERVSISYATGSFFTALGVQPVYGRNFLDEEDVKGRDNVALVSWAAWQKRYGGDPAAVGRTVTLNGRPYSIVGILPANFRWQEPHEFYIPFGFDLKTVQEERGARSSNAIARLAPGVSLEGGRRALDDLSAVTRKANPDHYSEVVRWHFSLTPLRDRFVGSARQPLLILLGAVLLVLFIACANVANLLLSRGAARSREIAVRSALGAGRARIVRQLLTESAILATLGAVCGVLLSVWSLDVLLAAAPESVRNLSDVRLDRAVLAFAAVLAVTTTLLFGLAPALHGTRADVADSLKDGAHATAGPGAGRLRKSLVVGQFALSLVLLAGAGLLLRSFAEVLRVRPGFDSERVLSAQVSLGGAAYEPAAAQERYWAEVLRRVQALPGVEAAGAISIPPTQGRSDWSYAIESWEPNPGEAHPDDQFRRVTPGYFRALRIPVRGREFSEGDDEKAPLVMLVNEAWVRRFFPGQDVIGRVIHLGSAKGKPRTVVGVVGDTHDFGFDEPTPPVIYAPEGQLPDSRMVLMVRVAGGPPRALAQTVRATLTGVDAGQPVDFVGPFDDQLASSLAARRFPLQLLGMFAVLAVALSALGIYGVTAHGVTQRTREFAVRMAIGASEREVLAMVVAGAARLAALGVGIGLCAALLGARIVSSQLYGVSARDPLTFLGISALLAFVALVASWLPARRATRVDPMTALRAE